MRVYGVTGWKNSGKTVLVERLVAELTGRGLTVSTVKHAHHAFDVDQPGKDSHRHRSAGAAQVLVASREPLGADERAARRRRSRRWRRCWRGSIRSTWCWSRATSATGIRRSRCGAAATAQELIAAGDATIEAVASDAPLPGLAVPVFDLDDVAAIADFILARTGLG